MRKALPLSVFCSYAHKDEVLRKAVHDVLKPLFRNGLLEIWYDREILPGQGWAYVINEEINKADLILLLVSMNFLASNYCTGVEVERALERRDRGEAVVIPIILRECYWQDEPFASFEVGDVQVLPKDGKPIQSPFKDSRLRDVVEVPQHHLYKRKLSAIQ